MNLHTALDDRSIGQQRRSQVTANRRRACLDQIIQYIAFLLAQRGDRRQDVLDEVAAVLALRAEATSSPKNGATQATFRTVVGGFDAFDADKGSQRDLQLEEILAGVAGLVTRQCSPFSQEVAHARLDRLHRRLEIGLTQGAIAHSMPQAKHFLDLLEQGRSNPLRLAAPLDQGLKVSFQVRPAQLPWVEPVVAAPAIRSHNALDYRSQHLLCALRPASGDDQKQRHQWGGVDPQPSPFCLFAPTGLVYVPDGLLLHVDLNRLYGFGQCRADLVLLRRDAAQADVGVEDRLHDFYVPLARADAPRQVAHSGLHPRAKTTRGHLGWTLGGRLDSTRQARQRMLSVFGHFRFNPWQFRHLMAHGLSVLAHQQRPTVGTGVDVEVGSGVAVS